MRLSLAVAAMYLFAKLLTYVELHKSNKCICHTWLGPKFVSQQFRSLEHIHKYGKLLAGASKEKQARHAPT